MKTIVLSLVAIAAGALSIGCSVDMKGSFEGKCSVSTLGREDAGKVKKTCTIEATESEMTLTVPGFVRCSGPKSKKGEMNAVFDATCNRIDADGDAVDKPCKLTGPFELHKRGDDEYELLAASITVVDEKKCEFSWLIKVGEKDPNTQLGSTKMKKK